MVLLSVLLDPSTLTKVIKMDIMSLTIALVQNLYLERVNNFLTDEKFADHYNMSLPEAKAIIEAGAELQETYAQLFKKLVCLQNLK